MFKVFEILKFFFFSDSEQQQITRSHDFSPFRRAYRGPGHGSPAARSVQSESLSPQRSFQQPNLPSQGSNPASRLFATPPAPRRGRLPSPKANRPSWVQRHLQRRPKTVNVDDSTLSGKISDDLFKLYSMRHCQ